MHIIMLIFDLNNSNFSKDFFEKILALDNLTISHILNNWRIKFYLKIFSKCHTSLFFTRV